MISHRYSASLVNNILEYVYDPAGFVEFAFDWGHGELFNWSGPDIWQKEILNAIGEGTKNSTDPIKIAVSSGHGIGKGTCAAWIILWAMSTRPHLSGIITANTANQLNTKSWRELAVWHKRLINRNWFTWTKTKFYHNSHKDTWFVAAIPWSEQRPEAFAGLHARHVLVIFDEASAIPNNIWDVCEGAMTTESAIWCVFGNPTRNNGRFYDCFNKLSHRWQNWKIDSRTTRMVNNDQVKQWIEDYGEKSDFISVRVKGEFPESSNQQFISHQLIKDAVSRQMTQRHLVNFPRIPLIIGVDIARYGNDSTVIAFRCGTDARSLSPFIEINKTDTMTIASRIHGIITNFNPDYVYIDGGGVGGGVIDRLRELKCTPTEINFAHRAYNSNRYANQRAEMWDKMREWLKVGCLPDNNKLKEALITPHYYYDSHNRLLLESKENMKRRGAPPLDQADALALTFSEPESIGQLSHQDTHSFLDEEYDPFLS